MSARGPCPLGERPAVPNANPRPLIRTDWAAHDQATREERHERAAICARDGQPLPWGPYRAAPHTCFRCGARIVVYSWLGHTVRSDERPPAPRPRSLCERSTHQSGGMTYWANTCACCGVTQGDNYLYLEEGAGGPPPFGSSARRRRLYSSLVISPEFIVREETPEEEAAKIRGLVDFMQRGRNHGQ